VSVLVVDERSEVRNSLWELLRDPVTDVAVAENSRDAFEFFPELARDIWPDILILGQGNSRQGARQIVGEVRNARKDIFERTSIILFPAFQAEALADDGSNGDFPQFCRMSTLANLMAVVRGLAQKKLGQTTVV
jgi:hypothetical protein